MDTYKIRRYNEKKDEKSNLLLGGISAFVIGLVGAAEFGGNYRFKKRYLKEIQKREKSQ